MGADVGLVGGACLFLLDKVPDISSRINEVEFMTKSRRFLYLIFCALLECALSLGLPGNSNAIELSPTNVSVGTFSAKPGRPSNAAEVDSEITRTKAESQGAVHLSAKQILNKVADAYGKCRSYKDSGESKTEFTMKDGSKAILRTSFRTALRRGAFARKFRFTYRENPYERGYSKASVLLHDRNGTFLTQVGGGKFERQETLGTGVARLTGTSSGTAHFLPALLLPDEVGGRKIIEMSDLKPPQIEMVEKSRCYRVEGLYAKEKMVLWITADSFLIVKIEDYATFDKKLELQSISYSASFNERVPDRLFNKQVEGEWKHLKQTP